MQYEAKVDDSLTPISMVGYVRDNDCLKRKFKCDGKVNRRIPPNLLFFEIAMEAYMGYQWRGLLNSADPTFPRGAIMGGAVVAALSSWEFAEDTKQLEEALHSGQESEYADAKKSVLTKLHEYFLHHEPARRWGEPEFPAVNSIFSKGDVDIFLERSPLTRTLLQKLTGVGFTNDTVGAFFVGWQRHVFFGFSERLTSRVGFYCCMYRHCDRLFRGCWDRTARLAALC